MTARQRRKRREAAACGAALLANLVPGWVRTLPAPDLYDRLARFLEDNLRAYEEDVPETEWEPPGPSEN